MKNRLICGAILLAALPVAGTALAVEVRARAGR